MALRRWESEGQKNLDLLAGFFSTVAYLPRQLGITLQRVIRKVCLVIHFCFSF